MSGPWAGVLRLLYAAREAYAAQSELWERYLRRQRPWEDDCLHWTWTGDTWRLSGTLPPKLSRADRRWARDLCRREAGRRRSDTSDAWSREETA